jgi:hypothetical protein
MLFRRLRSIGGKRLRCLEPALLMVFVFLPVLPLEESPNTLALKAQRAQELVDELRAKLRIDDEVKIAVVIYHPLVFSVEPVDENKDRFKLSMELGFLLMLDDDELRAAVAHELGHVWVYKHHPYLQTERMANSIGQRVADRNAFKEVYSKLWAYEGTSGVPIDDLLGPPVTAPKGPAVASGLP